MPTSFCPNLFPLDAPSQWWCQLSPQKLRGLSYIYPFSLAHIELSNPTALSLSSFSNIHLLAMTLLSGILLQDCCICFQAEPFLPHSTVPSPLLCVIFLRARRACIHWSPILWQSLYISKYNLLLSAHTNHIKQDSSYFLYLHKTLTIFVPRYPLLFLFQTAPSLFSCPFSPLLCWGSNSCWASVLPRIYSSLMSLILN